MPRVLVVEDDADTAFMLTHLLRGDGWRVRCVAQGADAIRHCTQPDADEAFDLMLLDLMLPDVDGTVVAERVHRAAAAPPRIIVLSSRAANTTAPGVVASFRKPFDVSRLLAAMGRAVGRGARVAPKLAAAIRAFRKLHRSHGDEAALERAEAVVRAAREEIGDAALREKAYELDIALRAFEAAASADEKLSRTFVPSGGGDLDLLVGDACALAEIQVAIAIVRHYGEELAGTEEGA